MHYESNIIHEAPMVLLIEFIEYELLTVIKTDIVQLHNRLQIQRVRFTNIQMCVCCLFVWVLICCCGFGLGFLVLFYLFVLGFFSVTVQHREG